MGVLTLDEFNKTVSRGLEYVKKDKLIEFAVKHGIDIDKKAGKYFIAKAIENSNVGHEAIYKAFSDENFGVISSYLQELLKVDHKMIKKMESEGFIKVAYTVNKSLYGKYTDIPCYRIDTFLDLEEKDIEAFVKSHTKEKTEKQKEALEKAAATRLKNKTCKSCGEVQRVASDLSKEGLCGECINRKYFKRYLDNKDEFVILDTETTGLGYEDEIIEISIIDMEGNILLDTLVSTDKTICDEAYYVHGVSHDELKGKPTIKELKEKLDEILDNKTAIIYNSDFDKRMLSQSGYEGYVKSVCLMHDYMDYVDSKQYISLARAMSYEGVEDVQEHRALGDCMCCLNLIKAIANKKTMV